MSTNICFCLYVRFCFGEHCKNATNFLINMNDDRSKGLINSDMHLDFIHNTSQSERYVQEM